ncbi:MAG: D-sedoheptulose 7-phosphate isomerase [Deltaproteobacteria bacterium]|nr:D-sedoheptulose 7-phosphate isomerase [Deltaproteobacteria bacterium]MBW2019885.1 D-sedoheptulose 7-phosphate isomerase [Deltaproteobacteria bacterium]MBW2074994.1 D-sedoheptulose 7-phosphate isomerase [Deltaproteobacteria bacterium]RLB82436.1 MAG: phosphoheptose isomerase [Deltaproteobacteria bacterium]
MKDIVLRALEESIRVKERFIKENMEGLLTVAQRLATCFAAGYKLLIFGNGGSAADAQHIAAEFVNRFTVERKPLPALALTTDTSILTSIANDYSFDEVFSKQIKALGRKDDIAWGISTSGNSKNVLLAVETARKMGLYTLGLTGCNGGKLSHCCDLALIVDSQATPRIQETHIIVGHILCDLVDRILFPESFMAT